MNKDNFIENLSANELYYLMGHASELSFSDWFKWLRINNEDIFYKLIKGLINDEKFFDGYKLDTLKREKNNMDILINLKDEKDRSKNKKIVIENKMKSIQKPMQLINYSKKYINDGDKALLLSLTRPVFFEAEDKKYVYECEINLNITQKSKDKKEQLIYNKNKSNNTEKESKAIVKWEYVSYEKLYEKLIELLKDTKNYEKKYTSNISNDLINIINNLNQIAKSFEINDIDNKKYMELIKPDEKLEAINLHAIKAKYTSAMLAAHIRKYLQENMNIDIEFNEFNEVDETPKYICSYGYTNKNGFFEFKYITKYKEVKVASVIQVQGKQLRTMVEIAKVNSNVMDSLCNIFFSNKHTNQYKEVCKYVYETIDENLTIKELGEKIKDLFIKVIKNLTES